MAALLPPPLSGNSKGAVIGAVETLEDITQAKRAEEAFMKAHEGSGKLNR